MVPNAWKKYSKFVFLAYLILAIMGTFTISIGEVSSFEHSNKDVIGSGRYYVSISHVVDCLAEDTTTIGKAYRFSNSALRNGLFRVFTFAGTFAIALHLAVANIVPIKNDAVPLAKNHILLKLRI
jgi:hypothetical protein